MLRKIKCPKCGQRTVVKKEKVLKCENCGHERQRFIKPEDPTMFLTLQWKDQKTKKFLEDIRIQHTGKEYITLREGLVFLHTEEGKVIAKGTIVEYCHELVAKMEDKK